MRILPLILILLTLALPLHAQEATGTIATDNTAQQDANIATRIRDILEELGNYDDVTVMVSEGIVTLRGTTDSAREATDLGPLATRVEGVVAVKNQVTETTEIVRRLDPAMERFRIRLAQLIGFLPLALIAFSVFAVVVLLGFLLARRRQPWERFAPNAFIAEIYRQLVRIVFIVAGVVIALDIINATALLGTILGAAGIIGLALGFAVRDTVENFIASIMLSIRQPFRPNDTVEINGDQGKVIRLTSRATILLSFDGNHIRIPNATVFKSRIINFSQNAERRFLFTLSIDRDADLQATRALVAETVQGLPFVLPVPAAQAWIEDLTPGGVDIVMAGWIDQNETSIVLAKGEAIRQVKLAVEAAGVQITDATQRIAIDGETNTSPTASRRPPPVKQESAQVEEVTSTNETALDKIINAEREMDTNEDLLREGAMKE